MSELRRSKRIAARQTVTSTTTQERDNYAPPAPQYRPSNHRTSGKYFVQSDEDVEYESDFIDDEDASDWENYAFLEEQFNALEIKYNELEEQRKLESSNIVRLEQIPHNESDQQEPLLIPERLQLNDVGIRMLERKLGIPSNGFNAWLDDLMARDIDIGTNEPATETKNVQEPLIDQKYSELPISVQQAVIATWMRRHSRYTQVKVLLVSWNSDDMVPKLSTELDALEIVFKDLYHYDVSKFEIPEDNPSQSLSDQVHLFIGDDSPETLLIFFYSGHGGLNPGPNSLRWSAAARGGPHMLSHPIQVMVENCLSDAILFYDACGSAETSVTTKSEVRRGVTELIAACGFNEKAPGIRDHSFTASLTKELKSQSQAGVLFSVSYLFSRVLSSMKKSETYQKKSTPVHTRLVCDRTGRQIKIQPLDREQATHEQLKDEPEDGTEDPSTSLPVGVFFKTSQHIDAEDWQDWFMVAPPGVRRVLFTHTAGDAADQYAPNAAEKDEKASNTTTMQSDLEQQ